MLIHKDTKKLLYQQNSFARPTIRIIFSSEAPPTFGEVKVVHYFEIQADALKFCSTSVRIPYFIP